MVDIFIELFLLGFIKVLKQICLEVAVFGRLLVLGGSLGVAFFKYQSCIGSGVEILIICCLFSGSQLM
jgi:hypothetical protein